MGGVVAGALLLLGIILYRRRNRSPAADAAGDANTSPETGMPVEHPHANTPVSAGYPYGDKDGAAPPYHANYGAGQHGVGEVTHELEGPGVEVAELGSGEVPGKG